MRTKMISLRIVFWVVIFLLIVMIVDNYDKYQAQKEKRDVLSIQLLAAQDENATLKNRLAEPVNSDYIINLAREKLDLHLPEEIVINTDLQ